MAERTICAVSTPSGEGGIGVLRISGEDAISISDKIFKSVSGKTLAETEGYSALFGHIYEGDELLDEAVVTVFRAPKSYTGENVVEISCHGGSFICNTVLRAVINAGASPADAGEFTKRAFLNGKLDLLSAESVMGLISAKSREELRLQLSAKKGKVSAEVEEIEKLLLELSASFAVYSDYPDEELPETTNENFLRLLSLAKEKTEKLLNTYDSGKILREGVKTAIVGKPNVGKSTLMNLISRETRSIVTDIAGTTRDVIENTVSFAGLTLILADTAGIHQTDDRVEGVGVELAKERLLSSQLVLAVFDGSRPLDSEDSELLSLLNPENTVIILNKEDLGNILTDKDFGGFLTVTLSAKNDEGAESLEENIKKICKRENIDGKSAVLLSERQRELTLRASKAIKEAESLLKAGFTIDAVSVCVDEALSGLYTLDGKQVTSEVADEVFRRFCVGK